ncbi:MAG: phytoene/squalene synthase family protein [Anaerolineales bacterium]|nr:phytoene/squalene synthase family protein [Anaerolineales bacterium]MBP6208171.1 phytoene/squalene synthase family protein [Anaerolineales bacterium]MBP8165094.1 phytoene/squalene synthase family protein [Anaerolineales bacterium]
MQVQANWENQLLALAGQIHHPATRPFFSYWAGDASLQKAYKEAEVITSAHSKSFHFASGLLPEEKRSAARALYAFCRTVDDIVDEVELKKDRDFELNYWRNVVQTASASTDDLVAAAWADTLTRYHIPRHYALQLIDGVARDLSQTRYQTFEDLATYCYGVASTVGLMSMYIVGFKSHEAVPYAIKLGVALQMTNILRDVGEDYRNGRLYLPREELVFYGINEADIAEGRVTDNWRNFMRFQIDRTRTLYKESWEGVKMLQREGQLAIGAASVFYQGILDDIEKHDYDVFSRRASLSAWGKISRVPGLWLKIQSL